MAYKPRKIHEYRKDELALAVESMRDCIDKATEIKEFLKTIGQPGFDSEKTRKFLIEGITKNINSISSEPGYELFVEMFKITSTESGERRLPKLIEVVKILNNLEPDITWLFNKVYLYEESIEEKYETLSANVYGFKIDNIQNYRKELVFDSTHQLTVFKLLNEKLSSPRAREIFNYLILILTNELNDHDIDNLNSIDCKTNKNSDSSQNDLLIKEIKTRAKKYYDGVKNKIISNKEIPNIINAQDAIWDELVTELKNLQAVFIQLKDEHKDNFILYQQELDDQLNFEIVQFMEKNNMPKSIVPPSSRQLQKYKFGSALAKKINDIGTQKVQESYKRYIEKTKYIESEIEIQDKIKRPEDTLS